MNRRKSIGVAAGALLFLLGAFGAAYQNTAATRDATAADLEMAGQVPGPGTPGYYDEGDCLAIEVPGRTMSLPEADGSNEAPATMRERAASAASPDVERALQDGADQPAPAETPSPDAPGVAEPTQPGVPSGDDDLVIASPHTRPTESECPGR